MATGWKCLNGSGVLKDLDELLEPRAGTTPVANIGFGIGGVDFAQRWRGSSGPGDRLSFLTKFGRSPTEDFGGSSGIFRRLGYVAITGISGGGSVTEGDSVSFTVTIDGASVTYEWRKNGTPISGAPNSATYTFTAALGDDGTYTCRVFTATETVTSGGRTLSVAAYVEAPNITGTSGAGTYTVGDTIALGVTATGDSLNYEWWKNGTPIGGAPNASSYSFTAGSGDSGSYQVRVYNSANSVLSSVIAVVVESASAAPNITSFSVSPTVAHYYDTVTVSLSASDVNGDMSYIQVGFYINEPAENWVEIYGGAPPNGSSFSTSWTFEIPDSTSILYGGKFTAAAQDSAGHWATPQFYEIGINP